MNDTKVILVTGASSGIGAACAEHLARRGYHVFGTSRRAPFPPRPAGQGEPQMIQLDVDHDESVHRAVEYIRETTGRLDVVVNNAGFGVAGSVEDTTMEEARAQIETNFFGVLRVCKAVLPAMRERGDGLIINVSSLGGIIALPYQAFYSAAKFAVEGLTEALRMEVRPFGVRVVLVEPGDTRTGFTSNRRVVQGAGLDSIYAESFERTLDVVAHDEQSGVPPETVALLVERIVEHPSPRLRYRVGPAVQRLATTLKGILPGRLFETLLMKYYRLQ